MSPIIPVLLAAAGVVSNGLVKITSDRTYYDRKEGFACFNGHVAVVDPQYQLHADRAYVYTDATNQLKRIVAIGNVAISNETRRAYGSRATYFRESGLVVLHAGDSAPAEVRDIAEDGERIVHGKKIRFWTGAQQVEVVEAEITAPSRGAMGDVRGMIGR